MTNLIPGKLYYVKQEKHSESDELVYFIDPFCVYNYCLIPGDQYLVHKDIRYMIDYDTLFMYVGTYRYDSSHNDDVYYFKQFLYGAQIIYFRYISEYIPV